MNGENIDILAAMVQAHRTEVGNIMVVTDTDHEKWSCGLAQYLLDTYKCKNYETWFEADLTQLRNQKQNNGTKTQ